MEPPLHALVLLLPGLLLLVTSPAQGQTPDGVVVDMSGYPVRRGVQYWLVPPSFPAGGGLQMSGVNGSSCPPHVIQLEGEVDWGQALMIFPEEPRDADDDLVRVGDSNYVVFRGQTVCPQSTLWRAGGEYLTTGGTVSTADLNFSRFSIFNYTDGYGSGYVFRSCPSRKGRTPCSNVVVNMENRVRMLKLSSSYRPHTVLFKEIIDGGE